MRSVVVSRVRINDWADIVRDEAPLAPGFYYLSQKVIIKHGDFLALRCEINSTFSSPGLSQGLVAFVFVFNV